MGRNTFALSCAAAALALATLEAPARACGGCFQPPDAVSTVTDHRMVIALSNTQSTLWDQIQYTGNPGDFVWVLPTPLPADVQLADQSFFESLEQQTAPRVYGPPPVSQSGGGFGCGSGASLRGAADEKAGEDVTVYHQGEVGPYETATVGSDSPMALIDWLTNHGYTVPDGLRPIITFYVNKRWVFNALRLKPDQNTSQMKPVRVVFKGLAATFPLRMVAAGAGPSLGILLWVVADQRYQAMNYDTVTIDERKLKWSTASNRSNYRELFAATLAEHPKGAFITEFAGNLNTFAFPPEAAGDLKVATTGQSASSTYLTRLRTDVKPSLLIEDLTLTPAPSNTPVSNEHRLSAGRQQSEPIGALLGGQRAPMLAGIALLGLVFVVLRRRARADRDPT
ncbi:MAG: DUF2330 domain-containing protein [Myxococcales bacterium]|nr:DUF2330 domain-containing protein [Myxococcales bacterium]